MKENYLHREIEDYAERVGKSFKVLILLGPRQVGKSTMLTHIKPKNMAYVTLDDTASREYARTDPKGFLNNHPAPLLIDEVQYAPELFPYLKMIADSSDERGKYWLTGSQTKKLMEKAAEYFVGRAGVIKMNSLTYSEIHENHQKKLFMPEEYYRAKPISEEEVFETIFRGGMPELYKNFVTEDGANFVQKFLRAFQNKVANTYSIDREEYFKNYMNLYIERDVKNVMQIGDTLAFRKFVKSVALRTGEMLNYTSLANDAEITVPTAKNWLSILENSGLVYLLEAYSNSRLKQLVKSPKIVFMDLGLASFLCNWSSAKSLQADSVSGHFLESFVISEIIKSYQAHGTAQPDIYYYRDHDREEIDLVMVQNNTLYPFEIKKTATPDKSHVKNFSRLEATGKKIGKGGLICFYDNLIPLSATGQMIIPIGSVINASSLLGKFKF